ncbi:MAG: sulfur carrier protein ThiS [Candidatus Coatesbacteria bacterium]|nr:sulfur carrier protein ThiS [Candidatus Coatesbacteria bacterium]
MLLRINGETKEFEKNMGIIDLLSGLGITQNIIIELNGEIIKKDNWNEIMLKDNDILEIVSIVGGG